MGWTKQVEGDDHIIFHVGKELPAAGSKFVLVPGKQNAQGRGVYCSEEIQTKYSGGEYYKKDMDITPIFCIPMHGRWTKGKLKRDQDRIVYCSRDEYGANVIVLHNLSYKDVITEQGEKLRYYYSEGVSIFQEPKEKVYDKFADQVRKGELTLEQSLEYLKKNSSEVVVPKEIIEKEYRKAFTESRIPELPNFIETEEIYYGLKR